MYAWYVGVISIFNSKRFHNLCGILFIFVVLRLNTAPELATLYKIFNLFLLLLLLDIKLVISVSYPSWLIRLVASHHWQWDEQIWISTFWLLIIDTLLPLINLEAEVRSGVVNSDVGSGRSIAMETLLLA